MLRDWSLDWYRSEIGGEYPVIICHASMMYAAEVIAKDLGSGCKVRVNPLLNGESKVILVDPFKKIDPALVALVLDRYGPGKTWEPEDAL